PGSPAEPAGRHLRQPVTETPTCENRSATGARGPTLHSGSQPTERAPGGAPKPVALLAGGSVQPASGPLASGSVQPASGPLAGTSASQRVGARCSVVLVRSEHARGAGPSSALL